MIIFLKNLAGDIINISYEKDDKDDKDYTFWDFRLKVKDLLNIDDAWRLHFFINRDFKENKENNEFNENNEWYYNLKDGDTINYFVVDVSDIKIDIKFTNFLFDIIGLEYYYEHTIFLSLDDYNYEYRFYYNNKTNKDTLFIPEHCIRVYDNYIGGIKKCICLDNIDEIDTYNDLITLLINNKFIPIIYREKISHMINVKWTEIMNSYIPRFEDLSNLY